MRPGGAASKNLLPNAKVRYDVLMPGDLTYRPGFDGTRTPDKKWCTGCDEWHSLYRFGKRMANRDGLDTQCREKRREQQLQKQSYRRNHAHKVTPQEYNRLLKKQQGVCKICKLPPGRRRLHADHCHATGRVRGLLCHNCNLGLGNFRDDPTLLRSAIRYLVA